MWLHWQSSVCRGGSFGTAVDVLSQLLSLRSHSLSSQVRQELSIFMANISIDCFLVTVKLLLMKAQYLVTQGLVAMVH